MAPMVIDSIVTLAIKLEITTWVCFRTPLSRVSCKILSQLQVAFCAFFVIGKCQFRRCARCKQQLLTAAPRLNFPLMQDFEWKVYQR